MANEQNLIPQAHKLTVEEQSAGGKKSAQVRREKATLRKAMQALLDAEFNQKQKDGTMKKVSGADALALSMFSIASNKKDKNAVNAYRAIMQTVGELEDTSAEVSDDTREAVEMLLNAISR